jgi:hypothetical protein
LGEDGSGVTDESDGPIDPELAAKLQAGARVWQQRRLTHLIGASLPTLVWVLLIAMSRDARVSRRDAFLMTYWMGLPLGLYLTWMWVRVLASRMRFTETCVETSEPLQGMALYRLRLEDIVAVRTQLGASVRRVYVCRLRPGRRRGCRWVSLWVTSQHAKANTLLAEVRRRCELTETDPRLNRDYRATVWYRPGFDTKLLELEWWQK